MSGFLEANTNASVSAGTKTITITGGNVDASFISSGTAIFINNYSVVEAVSGTAPDGSGNSTITLRNNWPNTTVANGSLLAFNTLEGLRDAINNSKSIGDRLVALTQKFSTLLQSTNATEQVAISATENYTATPYQYLVNKFNTSQTQIDSLIGSVLVPSKPQFEALRDKRKKDNAGSGWDNINFDSSFEFQQVSGWENKFKVLTNAVEIDGIRHEFLNTDITIPDAPNGLQNKDLVTADFTDIAAAIASGGASLSNSYLNGRVIVIPAHSLVNNTDSTNGYLTESNNNIYPENGVLKEYKFEWIIERIPESVDDSTMVALMTGMGWIQDSKDKGLFTKGIYQAASPLCVQQRNTGAYHRCFNKDGIGNTRGVGADVNRSDLPWYDGRIYNVISSSDCFDTNKASNLSLNSIAGTINAGANYAKRADGKFYDAIYSSDVKDLRVSFRYKTPLELISTYSQKAISGNIKGFEPNYWTQELSGELGGAAYWVLDSTSLVIYDNADTNTANKLYFQIKAPIGACVAICDGANSVVVEHKGEFNSANIKWKIVSGALTSSSGAVVKDATHYVIGSYPDFSGSKSAEPMATDIIGRPDMIKALLDNKGWHRIEGRWLPEMPDGTGKAFKLNAKSLSSITRTTTTSGGISWSYSVDNIDSTNNAFSTSDSSSTVALWTYTIKANPYVLAVNGSVSALGKSAFGSWHSASIWSEFQGHLIGKVSTSTFDASNIIKQLENYQIMPWSFDRLSASGQYKPKHNAYSAGNVNSPAMKAFSYITENNGQHYLQWVYKEMVWSSTLDDSAEFTDIAPTTVIGAVAKGQGLNVTSGDLVGYWISTSTTTHTISFDADGWVEVDGKLYWSNAAGAVWFERWDGNGFGDDNTFTIIDNESVITDDNGNNIIVGQKRVALPYFTGELA